MGNIPLDLMLLPEFSLRRHSGTNFFAPPSQCFCEKFNAGYCGYGSACNKRHEPYVEVCCADWLLKSCSRGSFCEFYRHNPEGEPLSCLSRPITPKELEQMGSYRRRTYYFPEQCYLGSGSWRVNGDELTFRSGATAPMRKHPQRFRGLPQPQCLVVVVTVVRPSVRLRGE